MHYDINAIVSKPLVPKVLCLILILLIFWQITGGIISFFSISQPQAPTHQATPPTVSKSDLSQWTLNASLFGEYMPENIDGSIIKKSMLNLKVVGIFYTDNEAESSVLIHSAGDIEKIYHVGDVLPGGAILKRITSTGILLSHHGEIERLSLPKNELLFASPPKPLIKE